MVVWVVDQRRPVVLWQQLGKTAFQLEAQVPGSQPRGPGLLAHLGSLLLALTLVVRDEADIVGAKLGISPFRWHLYWFFPCAYPYAILRRSGCGEGKRTTPTITCKRGL